MRGTGKPVEIARIPLDTVKRKLLRRSDWMGLSVARPRHLAFPSAEERENLGRRRKVLKVEHSSRHINRPLTRHHVGDIGTARHDRPGEMQKEDISIRVGSNIHQSQTTSVSKSSGELESINSHGVSSGSMLLDQEVRSLENTQAPSGRGSPSSRKASEKGPLSEDEYGLITSLSAVRHIQSFDGVKAQSDLLREQQSIRNGGKSPGKVVRKDDETRLSTESSSSVIKGDRILQSNSSITPSLCSRPQLGKELSTSGAKRPTDACHDSSAAGHPANSSGRATKSSEPPILTTSAGRPNSQESRCSQTGNKRTAEFTLVHQVEAEKWSNRVGSSFLRSNAKRKSHQLNDASNHTAPLSPSHLREGSAPNDEDQAWRRFIFTDKMDKVDERLYAQDGRYKHRWARPHSLDELSLPEDSDAEESRSGSKPDLTPVPTYRTSANTTIFEPINTMRDSLVGSEEPSESDFLSQLSPMEGQLDERINNISVYANPARTKRDSLGSPSALGNNVLHKHAAPTKFGLTLHPSTSGLKESATADSKSQNNFSPSSNPSQPHFSSFKKPFPQISNGFTRTTPARSKHQEGSPGSLQNWSENSSGSVLRDYGTYPMQYYPLSKDTQREPATEFSSNPALSTPIKHPDSLFLKSSQTRRRARIPALGASLTPNVKRVRDPRDPLPMQSIYSRIFIPDMEANSSPSMLIPNDQRSPEFSVIDFAYPHDENQSPASLRYPERSQQSIPRTSHRGPLPHIRPPPLLLPTLSRPEREPYLNPPAAFSTPGRPMRQPASVKHPDVSYPAIPNAASRSTRVPRTPLAVIPFSTLGSVRSRAANPERRAVRNANAGFSDLFGL